MPAALPRWPYSGLKRSFSLLFLLAISTPGLSSEFHRLVCFFYDKTKPHDHMNALHSGLQSVWAKGRADEIIYVAGEIRDGFLSVKEIYGIHEKHVWNYYGNHFRTAMDLCERGVKEAFPKSYQSKVVLHMASKPSSLSRKKLPIVFKHYNSQFIKEIDKMVVFGDSLSDQGNLKSRVRIFPKFPYFAGRFSNEQIWIDYLQKMTGIAVQNFAMGGSMAEIAVSLNKYHRSRSEEIKKRLKEMAAGNIGIEIDRYQKKAALQNGQLRDPESTVFVLWIGANDYLANIDREPYANMFLDFPNDPKIGSETMIERVTDSVIASVKRLYKLGGRKFLVNNLPDLGIVPKILQNTAYHKSRKETREERLYALSKHMTAISRAHNQRLKIKLDQFSESYPDSQIILVDIFTGFSQARESINFDDGVTHFDYGLDQSLVEEICYNDHRILINRECYNTSKKPSKKKIPCNPHRALFWDGVHPSSFGHCLISLYIHQAAAKHSILGPASVKDYLYLCTWQ